MCVRLYMYMCECISVCFSSLCAGEDKTWLADQYADQYTVSTSSKPQRQMMSAVMTGVCVCVGAEWQVFLLWLNSCLVGRTVSRLH